MSATMTRGLLLAFLAAAGVTSVPAQSAPQGQAPVEKPAAPAPAAKPPQAPPAAPYTYDPEGRRDPFVSLIGGVEDASKPVGARPSGVPGLLIGEITVKGVIRNRGGFIALVQGPDEKTHMIRTGDKLLDGSVKSISPDRVVFSQDVNDPLSLVKQREVSKAVRQGEGRGGAPGF
jgi:type IV pilus assembly protein PilP